MEQFTPIRKNLDDFGQTVLSDFIGFHELYLDESLKPLNNWLESLEKNLTGKNLAPEDYWRICTESLNEVRAVNDQLRQLKDDSAWQTFQSELDKKTTDFHKRQPLWLEMASDDIYWAAQPEDSFRVSTWKRANRIRRSFRRMGFAIRRAGRKIIRRPPIELPEETRRFAPADFGTCFYIHPLRMLLQELHNDFRHQRAQLLHDLHADIENLYDQLLFPADYTSFFSSASKTITIPDYRELYSGLKKLIEAGEMHAVWKAETNQRFEEWAGKTTTRLDSLAQYAGTFILPVSKFSTARIIGLNSYRQSREKSVLPAWTKHFQTEADDLNKDIHLSQLLVEINSILSQSLTAFSDRVGKTILPALAEPEKVLAASIAKFETGTGAAKTELKKDILRESRLMLRNLRREVLPKSVDILIHSQLQKILENFAYRIRHTITELPDEFTLFKSKDLSHIPPESSVTNIAIKNLVEEELLPALIDGHAEYLARFEEEMAKITRDFSEIDQIVEFNLEAGLEMLEKGQETGANARQVVLDGLRRALNHITALQDEVRNVESESQNILLNLTGQFAGRIQQLGDNEKVHELRLRVARAQTRERIRAWRRRVLGYIRQGLPMLLRLLAKGWEQLIGYLTRLGKLTGLTPVAPDVEEELARYLAETTQKLAALPFVYKRLYRLEPLSDARFFEGRESELESAGKKFRTWKNGEFAVTALVGEKGSGRTTLLNFAEQKYYKGTPQYKVSFDHTIADESALLEALSRTFKFDGVITMDELEERILNLEHPVICIVENAHNLFMRVVNGFEAMERFLLLLSNTNRKVHWIVTFGLYAWRYLDRILRISGYFSTPVMIEQLHGNHLEEIIIKRHRVSGYRLEFLVPDSLRKNRKFLKLSDERARQDYLREHYFEQLGKFSRGNITVSILFWLRSIESISGDKLTIAPLQSFDPSFLRHLPADELFTFAAFLQHEVLQIAEHARIFRQDERKSIMMLNRMANRGILVKTENGYMIHALMYRPLVRTLEITNILH